MSEKTKREIAKEIRTLVSALRAQGKMQGLECVLTLCGNHEKLSKEELLKIKQDLKGMWKMSRLQIKGTTLLETEKEMHDHVIKVLEKRSKNALIKIRERFKK